MVSWCEAHERLDETLDGPLFLAGGAGYAEEVAVFNQSVAHHASMVVGAECAADVSRAVEFASREGMGIAVLNTGHGPSLPTDARTLLVTTRRMNKIDIDPVNRTARVEAGVRFGELVDAAAAHELAPLAGSSPGVGVVGYTLSGGASSTVGRKYGWASDHVTSLDVVTADGSLHRVTPQSGADLFAALLGGKSNFGIVTAMEFALFPVTHLYAGSLFFSGDHIGPVLRAYRELTTTAPDELTSGLGLLNFPPLPHLPLFMQGRLAVSVRISYVGDADAGQRLIEPLRHAAPVELDTIAEIPYTQFATITNDPTDPATAVEHFGLLRELTEDTVDAIVEAVGPDTNSQLNIVDIRHLQGAFGRPSPVPNAVGRRDAAFAYFGLTVVPPGQQVADFADCGRELVEALQPWACDGAHPSFLGPADATMSGTRRAYADDTYQALRAAKAKYDPHNRFRTNHNIPPGSDSMTTG